MKKIIVVAVAIADCVIAVYLNGIVGFESIYTHLFYLSILFIGVWFCKVTIYMGILFAILLNFLEWTTLGGPSLQAIIKGIILILFSIIFYKLTKNHEIFHFVMDTIPNPLFIKNNKLKYIACNKSFETFLGKKAFEILGKTAYEISNNELSDINSEMDKQLLVGQDSTQTYESKVIAANNVVKDVVFNKKAIKNKNTFSQVIIGVITDVTEMKEQQRESELMRAKEKSEAANLAKSKFLANMSHEIRTPLNGVMGMLQLLQNTGLSEEQKEYIQISKESSNSLLEVLNDILDYSKMEAGKLALENNTIVLSELIKELRILFIPAAIYKGLVLRTIIHENVPNYLKGDEFKLRQILSNLIGNAIKFTNQGSVIVEVRNNGEMDEFFVKLEIMVRDTGIGIQSENAEEIFGSFIQEDSSMTRKYGGNGLGLAICKGLVEKMKGEIWVESKEGEGSSFYFTCIVEKLAQENHKSILGNQNIDVSKKEGRNIQLLIVEDDKTSQLVIEQFARQKGWHTTLSKNGKEAMDFYEANRFDAIFMDVQMPVIDGYKATKIIRQLEVESRTHIPIIAMTACALKGDQEKCKEAGMDDYLTKPLNMKEFFLTVEKWTKEN